MVDEYRKFSMHIFFFFVFCKYWYDKVYCGHEFIIFPIIAGHNL